MFESPRSIHRQIEDVDPGWLRSEVTAMARSALIAVGLSITIGLSVSEYLTHGRSESATRIVIAPTQPSRGAPEATSCPDGSSRCASPAASR